jgi:hypothetical protein
MDEDKVDTDDMVDNNTDELIKTKIQNLIRTLDNYITRSQSGPETIKCVEYKEIYETINKGLNWFFAISVGTLLWILGNFDKFIIADGSIPYKTLYIGSISFVGLSSVILTWLEAKLILNQVRNIINYNLYKLNHTNFLRDILLLRKKIDLLEKGDFKAFNALSVDMGKIDDERNKLDKSIEKFNIINRNIINNGLPVGKLMLSVISYIFGIIFISAYILIFVVFYV